MALGLVFAVTACSASTGPGPFRPAVEHGWSTYQPVGSTFTDGLETLELRGKKPAIIDSVKLVPGKNGDGLKLIGVQLGNRSRGGTEQKLRWPPRDPDHPASAVVPAVGATIPPTHGDNWELLLGIKVTKPGYLLRRAVKVDYHVGDQHYTDVIPGWLAVCTSHRYDHHNCPLPKGD